MSILVTGAAGFIGSNFVHYFLKNYKHNRLIGLDALTYAGNLENLGDILQEKKENFTFIKGDITDRSLVEDIFSDYRINGVINFAAESHVDRSILAPEIFLTTNIIGTHVLLDVCKQFWLNGNKWAHNRKFLQVSTDEVYGSLQEEGFFTESSPLDPRSPYAASKAGGDLIVKAFFETYNMPINIARSSNNYGPYQFPEKLIPLMIMNALNHKPLPIYGDGKQIRDWVYVEDNCRALDIVFNEGREGEIYNIGSRNERTNLSLVKQIIRILREKTGDLLINEKLINHVTDRLGHDRRYAIDPSKIVTTLSWVPKVEFESGLDRTIQWYLDNREWMDNVTSGEYLSYYEKNYEWRRIEKV
ncbi:MAG: dTDP-glucose 4,6-dehydratase [Candidatus Thorarchaeota archaeon]